MNAPISLSDIFGDVDSYNENDRSLDPNEFKQKYEIQEIKVLDKILNIRQFSWHQTNANQVWPGTFRLAEYIINNAGRYNPASSSSSCPFKVLELGAATGALSIFLKSPPYCMDMITSDIDDGGEIFENIIYNYKINGS